MYRFFLVLVAVHTARAVTEATLEDLINQIFGVETDVADTNANGNDLATQQKCNVVEGRGAGCYECRFCNDTFIRTSTYQMSKKVELLLKNDKCTTEVKVCCVAQTDLLSFRSNDNCGKPNPEGKPRRRRLSVRSTLQGEFPWRAWVYSKNSMTPLCAATFIHEEKEAFLTLASCVSGRAPASLEIGFTRMGVRAAVTRVIAHEGYRTGSDANNLAILQLSTLRTDTPTWALPACLPCAAPPEITSCVTTTSDDLRIDMVIPVQSECTADKSALPERVMCALQPPDDYTPQMAAGFYCSDQHSSAVSYTVQGLYTSVNKNIALYVDVWQFVPWIKDKLGVKD